MKHYGSKANYYALFLVMIAGMNGLVLSADLFNVYIFLEVAAVASYALVAFGLESDELEASFKYLMLSVVASAFVLIGIAVLFGVTGDVSFAGRGPGAPGHGFAMGRRRLLGPVHHGLRAQGGPHALPRLASGRAPFGPGAHLGHAVGPPDQGLGRLRPDPDLLQRLRA